MAVLRVIVDQIVAPAPGPLARYTQELTSALIDRAPADCTVEGIVTAVQPEEIAALETALPGMDGIYRTTLARRELMGAWQLGLTTSPGGGMIHAPSLFAPLRRHDIVNDGMQVVVTIHDLFPWTHPDVYSAPMVAWHKGMLKRARKHADAIVVPTHALADQLAELGRFGDRVRVIGTAPRSGLQLGPDADDIAERLSLPAQYLVTVGSPLPRTGLPALIRALAVPDAPDLPLLVIGEERAGEDSVAVLVDDAGLAPDRVRVLGEPTGAELAVILSRSSAFVAPARAAGSGTELIEAFALATPVIHSDAGAYVEVAGDAGVIVEQDPDDATYAERLAHAISEVLHDGVRGERLRIAGSDRARAFSWADSADRIWQLHAEL